jgi:hypothetical protein
VLVPVEASHTRRPDTLHVHKLWPVQPSNEVIEASAELLIIAGEGLFHAQLPRRGELFSQIVTNTCDDGAQKGRHQQQLI